jgi:hypothetical protein
VARFGVHRRALAVAVRDADWLEPKGTDAAALQVARDLADRLDAMRGEGSLFGDARTNWHVANIAAKYLAALVELRLTPERRPDAEAGGDDLIANLRAVVAAPE